MGIAFLKGHGTENDFVVLPDHDGVLELTESRVQALCDRQRGLGADGVLRVVPAKMVPDAPSEVAANTWFMDYRNADGSVAEMCGNGVRVFARYLVDAGLAGEGELVVGTRAGNRLTWINEDGSVTVDMGQPVIFGTSKAVIAGQQFNGIAVNVGNPHLVCLINSGLDQLDLARQPGYDPQLFPHGVNFEFATQLGPNKLQVRIHERGVGETRSCGTGIVAAVAATLHLAGQQRGDLIVDVPGGRVEVTIDEHTSTLTGPAVLLARGELSDEWWADALAK